LSEHEGFLKAAGVIRLFHGTRPTRTRKILREGLLASKEGKGFNSTYLPPGSSLSDFIPGWKPGVSLTTDKAHARIYERAGAALDETLGKVPEKTMRGLRQKSHTVSVDIPQGHPKLKRVTPKSGVGDEWRFEGDIPREWIKRSTDG